ncbi:response regulator [Fodinicola feengrottensis]|uniref:Response regulator transcription factor n=1 Tax=Fodinicola feengrottensis TaxID=435914 RepID=A0ABN2GNH6_9ACTN|nr:response regulator transcription factor [Fodinicola feengrottensis]
MTEPIRVLLADDHVLLRDSFRMLVEATDGFTIIAEAGTGTEAVELAREHRPDVVLMDVRMPEMDGIEATRHICRSAETADVRVIILTTFDLDEYVYAAIRAGASGFLIKDTTAVDLLAAIRVVAAGDALLAPTVTRRLVSAFARQPDQRLVGSRELGGVTDREREVLMLVARGLSNAEIADRLQLGVGTVKTHVGRLLSKLRVRDRAQLVVVTYESGLIAPPGRAN